MINLKGKTLSSREKHLHFTKYVHQFANVEIGDKNAPIQYYNLRNLSRGTLYYDVDTQPLAKLRSENYEYEVLKLINPEGSIPELGTKLLSFVFQPLEAKLYQVTLPIEIEGGQTYHVTFKGIGVDPNEKPQLPSSASDGIVQRIPHVVPAMQYLDPIIGQIARLSLEQFDFGVLPTLSVHTRLVVVRNLCKHVISFEWVTTLPTDPECK